MTWLYVLVTGLFGIIAFLIKDNFGKNKEINHQKEELEKRGQEIKAQYNNLMKLTDHVKGVDEIKKKRKKIDAEIKEAKTDEEVNAVIGTIIRVNNDRVRNR